MPDIPATAPEPGASGPPPGAAAPDSSAAATASKPAAKAAPSAAAGGLVSFTLDTASGTVVRVEAIDTRGGRHALSDEDAQRLAGSARETIEGIIERAFEAGIACVLGHDADEADEAEDAEDDAPITRLLLRPLIDHSAARRLMRREVLDRAALASLIRHARVAQETATEH